MKVVLVGDTQVGKTCVLTRLISGQFKANYPATIGAACQTHIIQTETGSVTMQIWDTAGQEKFRALAPMYYRGASAAILFFDVTNRSTFTALEEWSKELEEKGADGLITFIVGNKCDLADQRVVSQAEGQEFSFKVGALHYFETSAKTGEGIIEMFTKVAENADPKEKQVSNTAEIQDIGNTPSSSSSCC